MTDPNHPIVLFDGACNFCNASVDFIIQRDPQKKFRFASLQSFLGEQIRAREGVPSTTDTLILVQDERVYLRSTAALCIARQLKFPWGLVYVLIIVPRFIRDAVYDWFARHRYALFGQMDACVYPDPELRSRFLE